MESDRKRRVLFTGEASFLGTGFSTYANEVIQRLYKSDDIIMAEMGSYAHDDDTRCQQVPWKFYPVAPARSNKAAMQKYMSGPTNQFGESKFPDVCLDFKPDIVLSITDWWMSEYIDRSPLRHNFSWVQMPTIDGEPQREIWLDTYKRSDGILTYSDYGMNLLKKTGRRGTKLITIASPGADLEMFKPPDNKRDHKSRLGIDPNSLIVGTVMRNQKRKLYYDLIEAFSMWLHKSKSKGHLDLARRTFLYLHTSYPDVGYDIGKAIRDFKVGNKVIMTYLCGNCQTAYPSFFSGELMVCRKCGKLAAHPPNANHSCPRNVLADIMKTFDLYVQYSIAEGYGMPLAEAQACLPVGSLIETDLEWKPIESICIGDLVTGLDGKQHQVIKTMVKKYNNKLISITPFGQNFPTKLTPNHEVFVIKSPNIEKEFGEWIPASEISVNDIVVMPVTNLITIKEATISIMDYLDEENFLIDDGKIVSVGRNQSGASFIHPRCNRVKSSIKVDENFAKLMGYYVAEGDANEREVRFAFHEDEVEYHADVISLTEKVFGVKAVLQPQRQSRVICVCINSSAIAQFLRDFCGKYAQNKKIPREIMQGTEAIKKQFLSGYWRGDGCITLNHKACIASAVTISKNLCLQLRWLANTLGLNLKISYSKGNRAFWLKGQDGNAIEIADISGKKANKSIPKHCVSDKRKRSECWLNEDMIYMRVRKVESELYNGNVYNLVIENQPHYCTQSMLVHNCGVPTMAVRYSAMEDHLKCPTSIPIEVERFFWEAIIETEQRRALPRNTDFVDKLDRFLKQSESTRDEKSKQTRAYAEELVDTYGQNVKMRRRGWERTAAIWGQVIRETKIKDQKDTWLCPTSRMNKPNLTPPSNNMNNVEFVNWVIGKIWNRPDMIRTHFAGEWLKCLNSGSRTIGDKRVPFSRQAFVEHFTELVRQSNVVEDKRLASLSGKISDQINVTVM